MYLYMYVYVYIYTYIYTHMYTRRSRSANAGTPRWQRWHSSTCVFVQAMCICTLLDGGVGTLGWHSSMAALALNKYTWPALAEGQRRHRGVPTPPSRSANAAIGLCIHMYVYMYVCVYTYPHGVTPTSKVIRTNVSCHVRKGVMCCSEWQ